MSSAKHTVFAKCLIAAICLLQIFGLSSCLRTDTYDVEDAPPVQSQVGALPLVKSEIQVDSSSAGLDTSFIATFEYDAIGRLKHSTEIHLFSSANNDTSSIVYTDYTYTGADPIARQRTVSGRNFSPSLTQAWISFTCDNRISYHNGERIMDSSTTVSFRGSQNHSYDTALLKYNRSGNRIFYSRYERGTFINRLYTTRRSFEGTLDAMTSMKDTMESMEPSGPGPVYYEQSIRTYDRTKSNPLFGIELQMPGDNFTGSSGRTAIGSQYCKYLVTQEVYTVRSNDPSIVPSQTINSYHYTYRPDGAVSIARLTSVEDNSTVWYNKLVYTYY